ncbi:MAG: hypothetical protein J6L24_06990, partial [Oscillospiraceae bacterium]|nr:hypothetical protein [Oscillospiraceae bacterium]
AAEDFGSDESSENEGILYVFPVFGTARLGQKIRLSAEDYLFRGSLRTRPALPVWFLLSEGAAVWEKWKNWQQNRCEIRGFGV